MFEALVHENDNLPKTLKYHHLKYVLSGMAESLIVGLTFSEGNYDIVVLTVKERFHNKRLYTEKYNKA